MLATMLNEAPRRGADCLLNVCPDPRPEQVVVQNSDILTETEGLAAIIVCKRNPYRLIEHHRSANSLSGVLSEDWMGSHNHRHLWALSENHSAQEAVLKNRSVVLVD